MCQRLACLDPSCRKWKLAHKLIYALFAQKASIFLLLYAKCHQILLESGESAISWNQSAADKWIFPVLSTGFSKLPDTCYKSPAYLEPHTAFAWNHAPTLFVFQHLPYYQYLILFFTSQVSRFLSCCTCSFHFQLSVFFQTDIKMSVMIDIHWNLCTIANWPESNKYMYVQYV